MSKNHIIKIMETTDIIKIRIKELIKQSGVSQNELADVLNVSQSCIAHYIKGDILPSLDKFAKLCEFLDVDANYILGIKNN